MAQNKAEKHAEKPAAKLEPKAASAKSVKSQVALREEETLLFWEKDRIFQKTLTQNEAGTEFVFYDGPPFATGLPHYGHVLPGTMKDVIPRFKVMQGYNVRRQWGWDCHGLPIENIIEKELGLATKKDIEVYGIERFNKAARETVLRYVDDWKKIIPRTGRFVDMDNAYKTMDASYTESVWWSLKKFSERGLLYEGFKSMQICPRCETTLANFEVNQGYKDITDISVYVKFELKDEPNVFMLAWTTTPWTLPGNVALAVNPDVDYVQISFMNAVPVTSSTQLILAKSRLATIKEEYKVVKEFKGSALVGKAYKPLFDYYSADKKLKDRENGWKVCVAPFVTTDQGTGVVHIAPAFGAEDMELGRAEHLPFVQHVGIDGRFKKEVSDLAGQMAKPKDTAEEPLAHQRTDIEIIKYLAAKGTLFAKEKITHSYPHCWRCDTPLLNYASSSWFLKVTALKDRLVKENKKVNWTPDTIGTGRFGNWLEGAKDWAISRSRYWGAPLPVWKCSECTHMDTIGSIAELRGKIAPRNTYFVMRHGEAESNIKQVIGANLHTYHLTTHGRVQARLGAESLVGKGIDLIITSPYNRTRETGEIVREVLGLGERHMFTDLALHEINAGIFNDKPVADYHAYFSSAEEQFMKRPPKGESQLEIKQRMGKFIYELDQMYSGRTILIVTHDTPAWLLFAADQGADQKQTLALRPGNQAFLKNAEVRPLGFVPFPHNEFFETDLHRPYIDEVIYGCSKCSKGKMKRVPEVLDTWYDSGSMPFARSHYPFSTAEFDPKSFPIFKKAKGFPAEFIAEGIDQTRGWFYTLLVMSVGLFGKTPYENVIVNGQILTEDGKKMSKRLKNYEDISVTMDKYGADALRYYLMASPAVHAEDTSFSEKGVDEVYKKMILRLENVCSFYELYADKDAASKLSSDTKPAGSGVLDTWIMSRLAEATGQMTAALENYEIDRGAWPLEAFIDDLSTWFVRRSRDRFKSQDAGDKEAALATTRFVLAQFAKIMAPYMPFLAEAVYQKVRGKADAESVHLTRWPEHLMSERGSAKASERIISQMAEARKLVTLGLEARVKANIKVRQPLSEFKIKAGDARLSMELLSVIAEELNVKKVSYADMDAAVQLVTELTPELQSEGQFRELARSVQELRKTDGLAPADIVALEISVPPADALESKTLLEQYGAELKKVANIDDIVWKTDAAAFGLKLIKK